MTRIKVHYLGSSIQFRQELRRELDIYDFKLAQKHDKEIQNQVVIVDHINDKYNYFKAGVRELYIKGTAKEIVKEIENQGASSLQGDNFNHYYPTYDESFFQSFKELLLYGKNPLIPLLLLGETGTGKTQLASTLHKKLRPNTPFLSLNLLERNSNLIESELFGHKKGAFTGAHSDKEGLLSTVDGGTLFLDEVGSLPLETQGKLLKVIENQEYFPIGSNRSKKVSFHLISATCESLEDLIEQKKVREDFYYRINGHSLTLKPLRERQKDIPLILEQFQKESIRQLFFTEESLKSFNDYHWPGNLREFNRFYQKLLCQSSSTINEIVFPHKETLHLPSAIAELEKKLFLKSYRSHKGRTNRICQELGISKSVFYRLQEALLTEKSVPQSIPPF